MPRYALPALLIAVAGSTISLSAPLLAQSAPPRETAVAPEVNPPGDIPDNQVFITYRADAGYSMPVPEGWARSAIDHGVRFADKYDAVDLQTLTASGPMTVASVTATEAATLVAQGHAVDVTSVHAMHLPSGDAVAIDYLSNSEVNPVTNRKIRLENRRIYLTHGTVEAVVTLSAPAGADNVDQWKMMADQFRWAQ